MLTVLLGIIIVMFFISACVLIFELLFYGAGSVVLVVLSVVLMVGSLIFNRQSSEKKVKRKELKEDPNFEAVKSQFEPIDKYGDSYVSSKIGKVLWVEGIRWKLFNASEIVEYNVIEKKHNENSDNILGKVVVEAGTGFHAGDVIERLGVVFTVADGNEYELLEFDGNEPTKKMESTISRHNRLVRLFDEMVNGKIN
ncbi:MULTISPECIES: hypothetical protein [Lactobacillaceae]|jgi:hypothetical protein|nr:MULTISPECIES: hypothetical protein [Lactobacillaceae]NME34914.1 hypothetical protein [Lactobacillus sp. MRS-253-APC-2B]